MVKLFEKPSFVVADGAGEGHLDTDQEVSVTGTAYVGDALPLDSDHVSRLTSRGDLHRNRLADELDGDGVTQNSLSVGQGYFANKVVSVSYEIRVGFHLDEDVEIAGLPVVLRMFTFSSQSKTHSRVHPRGDSGRDLAYVGRSARAFAHVAELADGVSPAPAIRTGGCEGHKAGALYDLPRAITNSADIGRCSRRGAHAVAGFAASQLGELDLLFDAGDGLFEGELQVVTEIGAPGLSWRMRTASASKEIAAEKFAENVSEVRKDVFNAAEVCLTLQTFVSVAVVKFAFFRVAQDGVSLGGLFEPIFGFEVAGIAVWVTLERKTPIGLLDLF